METKRLTEFSSTITNNNEIEQNFRETCVWYGSKFSDQTSNQTYQKYIDNYHKLKSLYLITEGSNNTTQLIIYDTESEKEEVKILQTPMPLYYNTCLALLPNCELFCFYSFLFQQNALIIESNYEVRLLPSGLPLFHSSAIYFNSNIYCFAGVDELGDPTPFSRKFDLNENRWINLAPMPKADFFCHSVIFNDNILISGYYNTNLMLYSVEIDSFSIMPYEFVCGARKILINAERLYLIECFGDIYESQSGFVWEKIVYSGIQNNNPSQIYWVENKGEIYILSESDNERYFKFDLKQRILNKF